MPGPRREKAEGLDGFKGSIQRVEPWSAEDIASVETGLSMKLPDDLKAFLTQGLHQLSGSGGGSGKDHSSVGFESVAAETAIGHTEELPEFAADDLAEAISAGVAITYEEPCLVVALTGVYHFSVSNDLHKVADSFAAFLESYAASGCFKAGNFRAWWALVEKDPPLALPPSKNLWVTLYEKTYR